jgi:hypothetical protein
MEKTVIDWLIEQWSILESDLPPWLINQANEMFEQQIKDAYQTSHISMMTADQYYTEKFK